VSCAGDEFLRREVESLLAAHDQGVDFLDAPALEIYESDPLLKPLRGDPEFQRFMPEFQRFMEDFKRDWEMAKKRYGFE
jgi:hypothetical protein